MFKGSKGFFNICKEDCPACNNVADLDNNCRISFYEVITMIRKWVGREVSLQEVINSINLWLRG
jgi:hypothetical protein